MSLERLLAFKNSADISDIANKVNAMPKLVAVDEYPVVPEEGTVYYKIVLPTDPDDPDDPDDPTIFRYYTEGVENVEWVESYSVGDDTYATQSKEVDHLYLEIVDKIGVAANRTYATKDPVDLTDINTIEVDYESIDAVSPFTMRFGVTLERDKGNNSSYYVANKDAGGTDPRTVLSIDVSALTGIHYIRVAIMNMSTTESRYGKLKVYNVRGVKV